MMPLNIEWVEHLIWYDGPLLSLVKSGDQHYLDLCVDVRQGAKAPEWFDHEVDVRGLIKVSDPDLQKYMKDELTLRDVVMRSDFILGYVGCWSDPKELKVWSQAEMEALGYMPADGSFVDRKSDA